MADDLPFTAPDTPPNLGAPAPKRCRRHEWFITPEGWLCIRCGKPKDEAASRQNRNNRKRGGKAELDVAKTLNARKMGPLGLPWDVEHAGWIRLQVKKLARRPSLSEIIGWLDQIPVGAEMRGVALIEAAGQGVRGRRFLVLDLDEFAEHHGDPVEKAA